MARRKKPKPDHRIYLHDECPRIGCGWRAVTLKQEGYKWVHFFETATEINARLPVKDWKRWAQPISKR